MQLNKAQQAAVDHDDGALLVVAGAGTGKTRVIVERINRLLNEGVAAKSILAVTFTEKAAAEMLDRILESRDDLQVELPVMTFNAYGESILREFNTDVGLSSSFKVMGDNAKVVFLRQNLAELKLDYYSPISNPEGLLPDLGSYFSQLKQSVITPEKYRDFVKSLPQDDDAEKSDYKKHVELAQAYENYLRLCFEQNVIDYDDQIFRVIELCKRRPNVQKTLRNRYEHIMVDEFQDTNTMQSALIDLLTGQQGNLMVVGDDDQSIYGFRGATLSNILDFKARYKNAQEITLIENYRSSQQILDASYKLIQNNNPDRLETKLKINKKLQAQTAGKAPEVKQFSRIDQELSWLADDIAKRLKAGENPGDIAILCRRNFTVDQVSQALSLKQVEHTVIGEKSDLYRTSIVRMLVEALRTVAEPNSSLSLYHTLSSNLFVVDHEILAELSAGAKRNHSSLESWINQLEEKPEDLKMALEMINSWRIDAGTISVGRMAYRIIDQTGLKNSLLKTASDDPESAQTITQLSDFFKTLKEFESIALQPSTIQYLENYAVLEAAGETTDDGTLEVSSDRVNILTIHKSKGLEWPTVYIPDCTEGSFPMRAQSRGIQVPESLTASSSSEADNHMAEERRLMYVALTRAAKNLTLSLSTKHYTPTIRKPSRFITEVFGELPEIVEEAESAQLALQFDVENDALPTRVRIPSSIYDGKTIHTSVSKITTFINCPLDFYYRFVLNVPEDSISAAKYGTIIHEVIETINKALRDSKELTLQECLEQLEQIWQISGFISLAHAERSKTQARQTIENYYKKNYLSGIAPKFVEYPFSVNLKPENVSIKGRYDVVFESEAGIEIRDYKTSMTVTTPEKAKNRATGSKQLTLYALIWQELTGELPVNLSLEFVDTSQLGAVKKTQRGIDTMRRQIGEMAEAIKNNRFKPGKNHDYCQHPPLET